MQISTNRLFRSAQLSDVFREKLSEVGRTVDAFDKDRFLANSDEQIVEHIFSRMEIEPLSILRAHITRSELEEVRRMSGAYERYGDMPGVMLWVTIPFLGDSRLWQWRPSTYLVSGSPSGEITLPSTNSQPGELKLAFGYPRDGFSADTVNKEVEEVLDEIEAYLKWSEKDIESFNLQLRNRILEAVKTRRGRLDTYTQQSKAISIPLKKREGSPDISTFPLHRKVIQPLAKPQTQTPSYAIEETDYQSILDIIRHTSNTFERTPHTFSVHDEEGLRDILLANLNGHLKGGANAEAFRRKGKTDICIESENRAAFVAECKIWRGDKELLKAIDQLLGYLTWRDVKTALTLFNKDVAGFTNLQSKLPQILKKHPKFIDIEEQANGGEWRVRLQSKDDPERAITTQVFMFDLYVRDDKRSSRPKNA